MTPIQILDSQDAVFYSDFCRPLSVDENFSKWTPVGIVIPKRHHRLNVDNLRQEGYKFEFARGGVPDDHSHLPVKPPEVKKPMTKWVTVNPYNTKAHNA